MNPPKEYSRRHQSISQKLTFNIFYGCISLVRGHDMLEEGFIVIGCESVFRREAMPAEHGRSLEVATPLHPPRKGSTEKTSSPCQIHQRTEVTGHPAACPPRPALCWRDRGAETENHNLQKQRVSQPQCRHARELTSPRGHTPKLPSRFGPEGAWKETCRIMPEHVPTFLRSALRIHGLTKPNVAGV